MAGGSVQSWQTVGEAVEYITVRTILRLFTNHQRDGAGGADGRQETFTSLLRILPQRDLLRLLPLLQEHQVSDQQGQLQECALQGEQLLQLCRPSGS